jgi:transcriptional regulator with XRE-family HTH domain
MGFGVRNRNFRTAKGFRQRALEDRLGISLAYISKFENGKLDFGDDSRGDLIRRRATARVANEEELPLAEKIPEPIRPRFFEWSDAFRLIDPFDDKQFDRVLAFLGAM